MCVRRQTGHWLGQEMAGVCRQRSGSWASLINFLQAPRQGRRQCRLQAWEGDAIDPVLGQESSLCQPLIRITINQETIEQPSPKIEWKSTWEQAVNRVSSESQLTAQRHRPPVALIAWGRKWILEMCFIMERTGLCHLTSDPQTLLTCFLVHGSNPPPWSQKSFSLMVEPATVR